MDGGPFDGGWMGLVNEFRNHLTIFLAGTDQLSSMLPPAVASEFADRLGDMESSAEFLQTLLTWMDASLGRGSQAISEIGDLLRRAERLASTGLSPRVKLQIHAKPAAVRNRGVAIECALAALITELGRIPPAQSFPADGEPAQPTVVSVSVFPQRGALTIYLTTNATEAPTYLESGDAGWRVSLAKALLAQVNGTIEVSGRAGAARGPGFEVRFRFQ